MGGKFKKLIRKIKGMGFRIKEDSKMADPVCGMEIMDNFMPLDYKGAKYYFCSDDCRSEFESDPDKFIG